MANDNRNQYSQKILTDAKAASNPETDVIPGDVPTPAPKGATFNTGAERDDAPLPGT